MDHDQFEQLLDVIQEFATKSSSYTITGAQDWPMVLAMGGVLMIVLGAMWADLSNKLVSNKNENAKQVDMLWEALRECQDDCCPRGRKVPRD